MSRIILDTHVLLWAIDAPRRLPSDVAAVLKDTGNQVLFSAASIWEIAIKSAQRKSDFEADPAEIASAAVDTGFVELQVTAAAAARVAQLPMLHKDPFDRLLVAQALHEPALLYTADRMLQQYSELVRRFDPL